MLTEKDRWKVNIDHRKVLRFVIDSYRLVEGEIKVPTLKRTQEKFFKIDQAMNTLADFYTSRSKVGIVSTNVGDLSEDGNDDEYVRLLRRLKNHANIVREFEIGDAIQFPIVQATKAAHDNALNFACGLSFLLKRIHERPFEKFCLAMAGVVYEGSTVSKTALYDNCTTREERMNRALQEAMQRNNSARA